MTPDQRIALYDAQSRAFVSIMQTTILAQVALAAIITFEPDAPWLMMTVIIVAVAAYGILAGGAAIRNLGGLKDDMDEEMRATSYGQSVGRSDYGLFHKAAVGLFAAIAATQLLALWF